MSPGAERRVTIRQLARTARAIRESQMTLRILRLAALALADRSQRNGRAS